VTDTPAAHRERAIRIGHASTHLEITRTDPSLGQDDRGYGVPVAFAYDPETRAVYLRLGYSRDITKRGFVAATEEVTGVLEALAE
jgi:hypothetical protein